MGGEGADLAILVYVVENWGKECGYAVKERVEAVVMQRWLRRGSMTNQCQDFVTWKAKRTCSILLSSLNNLGLYECTLVKFKILSRSP